MENIKLEKFIQYKNGVTLHFKYIGTPNEFYDKKKSRRLIGMFLSQNVSPSNMINVVSGIRTILNTCDENLLMIEYCDKDHHEMIKYSHKVLISYIGSKNNDNTLADVDVEFHAGSKLNVSFNNAILMEYPYNNVVKDKLDAWLKYIDSLSHINKITMDKKSKVLIEVYQLFYQENPDFSQEDINIKMQTMVSILASFNLVLGDYSFSIDDEIPQSLTLLQKVNELFCYGEIKEIDEEVALKEKAKEKIKIIGATIRESVSTNQSINDVIITLSKMIYASRYQVFAYNLEDIKK